MSYTEIQKDIEDLKTKHADQEKKCEEEKQKRDAAFQIDLNLLDARATEAKKVNPLETTIFLHTTLSKTILLQKQKNKRFRWPIVEVYKIFTLGKPGRWNSFLVHLDSKVPITKEDLTAIPGMIDDAKVDAKEVSVARASYTTIETKRKYDESIQTAKMKQFKDFLPYGTINDDRKPFMGVLCTVCGGRDKYLDFMLGRYPVCCSLHTKCKKKMSKKAKSIGLYVNPGCQSCDKW